MLPSLAVNLTIRRANKMNRGFSIAAHLAKGGYQEQMIKGGELCCLRNHTDL